jgi:hypothetical protein
MSRAIASALLLAGLALAYAPLPTEGHDLRNRRLPADTVLLIKESSRLTDGVMEIDVGGGTQKMKLNTSTVKEQRVELLAVEGNRRVTKQRITWVKFDQKVDRDGEVSDQPNPIRGRTVVFELKKGGWEPKAPDPDGPLTGCVAWSADDVLFPARRVKPGDTWNVPEKELKAHYKEVMKADLDTATAKGRFKAVEMVGGESCAVVEVELRIKGKVEMNGTPVTMDSTDRMTLWRSLRTGLNVRTTMDGSLSFSTSTPLTLKMTAKQRSEHTLSVEEKP